MGKTTIKSNKSKKGNTTVLNNDTEVWKLVKILVAVTLLFFVFYLVTVFVTKKEDKPVDTPTTIQYTEIMLGNILKQTKSEYLVLLYDNDDSYANLFSYYLQLLSSGTNSLPYYTSVLDNAFNSSYISDEENLVVTDLKDLKVNKTTLFRIKDAKIIEAYSNKDEIEAYLKKLID